MVVLLLLLVFVCLSFQVAEGCMKVGEKAVCVIHIIYIYISILCTYTYTKYYEVMDMDIIR